MSIRPVVVRQAIRERISRRLAMKFNATLWVVQGLLALMFLLAGGMKLVLPLEALAGPVAFPGLFLRFIGVSEVAGAIGLILPSLLRIRPSLTPLAASGLAIIMAGATVTTMIAGMGVAAATVPLIVGALCGLIVYGRVTAVPIVASGRRTRRAEGQTEAAFNAA
jgi:hypothetical protein